MTATAIARITRNLDAVNETYGTDTPDSFVVTHGCTECNATGRKPWYSHVDNGVCYGCNGNPFSVPDLTLGELRRGAKRADADATREAKFRAAEMQRRAEWDTTHTALLDALKVFGTEWTEDVLEDEAFVPTEWITDCLYATVTREAEKAAEKAAAEPVPTGTEVLTGEIVSVKVQESYYGGRTQTTLKMVLKEDRGFKVYGTVPSALQASAGVRVRFTAAVEPSRDDPTFGFFKRPRKVETI